MTDLRRQLEEDAALCEKPTSCGCKRRVMDCTCAFCKQTIAARTRFPAVLKECVRLLEENEQLKKRLDREENDHLETIDSLDAMEEALADAHVAMGGDGEWVTSIPQPGPPDSGDLCRDVPCLARQLFDRLEQCYALLRYHADHCRTLEESAVVLALLAKQREV